MKNQLLNLKMIALMCLMMVLGGANVWAEDITYTHTFKNDDFGTKTTATSYSATLTGVSWNVSANPNFAYLGNGATLQIGSSSKACKSLMLSSKNISGTVKSVEIETNFGRGGTRNLAVSVGGTNYTYNSKTSVSLTKTSKKYKFVGNASGEIVISLTDGDKALFLKSLTIVYEGESQQGGNTLTISPAETSSVKAPIQVSLKASIDGSKIYYTTDNTKPTTESNPYTAPFEVTQSGTTVKALAVAEGAENVTAEATYTIKPDQPVFSDESKTFKDAFDVTLTLPKSTDETSEIHYAIGAKATASSPKYEAPINISAENEGDDVILHAVVVDKYGNVGTEKFCTYTKTNAIVFDFTADPNVWGITPGSTNGLTGNNVIAGKKLEVDGVVMTATNGEKYGTCIYQSGTKTPNLRIYTGGGSITLSAPEGKNISEILFGFDNTGKLTTTEASWSSPTWTGNAHEVTFKCTDNIRINTISIKLVSVTPEKTSETLDFKATDGSSYYATFSSDKDVVFTNDVTVYGVSVDGGKISTNAFTPELYEVTDATAGVEGMLENAYYVPANTGVLLECKKATATYYFFKASDGKVTLPDNQLMPAPANGGVFEATDVYKYYKLAYDNYDKQEGLGFYWGAPEGGKFFVKAGTAYLAVSKANTAGAKGFAFNGEATGIEGVNANVENANAIYNLNGQRVASMAKPGLYIVNGKKVVRK